MIDNTNRYTQMQQRAYDVQADMWSVTNRNPVVGYFDDHNEWDDYRVYLWKDIINLSEKEVLDFGCGPGRNLVKWHNLVKFRGLITSFRGFFKRCDRRRRDWSLPH